MGCCIFYKIFALYAASLFLSSSKLFQSFYFFISQRICIVSLVSLHSFVRRFFLLPIDFFIFHFVNFQHRSSRFRNFSIATDKEDDDSLLASLSYAALTQDLRFSILHRFSKHSQTYVSTFSRNLSRSDDLMAISVRHTWHAFKIAPIGSSRRIDHPNERESWCANKTYTAKRDGIEGLH